MKSLCLLVLLGLPLCGQTYPVSNSDNLYAGYWALAGNNNQAAFTLGESVVTSGSGDSILDLLTLGGSTAIPFQISNGSGPTLEFSVNNAGQVYASSGFAAGTAPSGITFGTGGVIAGSEGTASSGFGPGKTSAGLGPRLPPA